MSRSSAWGRAQKVCPSGAFLCRLLLCFMAFSAQLCRFLSTTIPIAGMLGYGFLVLCEE